MGTFPEFLNLFFALERKEYTRKHPRRASVNKEVLYFVGVGDGQLIRNGLSNKKVRLFWAQCSAKRVSGRKLGCDIGTRQDRRRQPSGTNTLTRAVRQLSRKLLKKNGTSRWTKALPDRPRGPAPVVAAFPLHFHHHDRLEA